ncbi:tetratricopeptide repeat protein [Cypionkella psychrotolerans]|uniref:tetratricopeptide repeat protein n=1 Tax=Cypionkella psychrotolerans TaxID=1678131 RepID=UPI000AF35669|nr:tetratricopeptide repeat protein [Cypionkella psychrotolerans]
MMGRGLHYSPGFRLAATTVLAFGLVVGMVALQTPQSNTRHTGHRDPAEVVATLHTGGRSYPAALRDLLIAARAAPNDIIAAKAAARALIDEGRTAGDSRLVGASLGVLRPFMAADDAEILTLAATARQYQHDFLGALMLLDRAIVLNPRDANALLIRATIHIVRGDFATAEADCQSISALQRPDLGFLCVATAETMTERAPAFADRIAKVMAMPQVFDPALIPYAQSLLGEIAALQGRNDIAAQHFTALLAMDPSDIRVRLMLADLLIQDSKHEDVLALLTPAPDVDGVLIRRYLAATSLKQADIADPAKAELGRRVRLNLDLGLTAHAREEAQYFLLVAPDPAQALARAQVNWALQHEIDDLRLLIAAAVAADQPKAAVPALAWMAKVGIVVPTLIIPDAVREAAK